MDYINALLVNSSQYTTFWYLYFNVDLRSVAPAVIVGTTLGVTKTEGYGNEQS